MIFAEFTPEGWVLVIGAIFLGAGQLANTVFSFLAKRSASVNADKIDRVQATQATKGQVERVRVMLNGEKTAMKRENAALAREVATASPSPENIARAQTAERNLADHEAQLLVPQS